MTRIINLHTKNNVSRDAITPVSSDSTIREALTEAGVTLDAATRVTLNSEVVTPDDLDITLDEFGVEGDDVIVGAVAKLDNATH